MVRRVLGALVVAVLVLAAVAWVRHDREPGATPGATPASPTGPSTTGPGPDLADPDVDVADPAYDVALSAPREDSYYPEVGDPGVDALHYDLDLTWQPERRLLTGRETLVLRATEDSGSLRLDLAAPLTVTAVELDGHPVGFTHEGKDLVVEAAVQEDERHALSLEYAGQPEPAPAPSRREDLSTTGWTTTPSGAVWTVQEPYGAFTWYAVNDQPSDKALYDFTLRVPATWTGVANGSLTSRTVTGGQTVTTFSLAEPAAAYLVTVAFGDYATYAESTAAGTPVRYWWLRSQRGVLRDLRFAPRALTWIERRLGPYPFSSAGILLTESTSGMETQTLVTLGAAPYVRSKAVIVHEMVHQWYGDLVTPADWRDVWMNEGMATYLQLVWESGGRRDLLDARMAEIATEDQALRQESGPPGAYDPSEFGASNVYYCPALMWHELRGRLGDREFWSLVRRWPRTHALGNATRHDWTDWIEARTGRELTPFFRAWLTGTSTPPVR